MLAELRSAHDGAPFDLSAITVPVLAGRSSNSRDHHRWAAQELADQVGGDAPFEIEGANHNAHVTHHVEFAAFVRAVVALAQ